MKCDKERVSPYLKEGEVHHRSKRRGEPQGRPAHVAGLHRECCGFIHSVDADTGWAFGSMQTLGGLYFVPDNVLGTGNPLGDITDVALVSVAFIIVSKQQTSRESKEPAIVQRARGG